MNRPDTDSWPQVRSASEAVLAKPILALLRKVAAEEEPASQLIAVLHKVQEVYGYLGDAQMDAVAQLLRVPSAKVTGVATFYHFFRLRPKGRYVISLCMGTACYVKGATAVLERLRKELGADVGGTSPDGVFSLEESRCLGACGLAPVLMIDGQVHGPLKPDDVPDLLARYRQRAAEGGAATETAPEALGPDRIELPPA